MAFTQLFNQATKLAALGAFGFGLASVGLAHAAPLKVVTSFSILEDMVKQVGGEEVEVSTIMGADADAHSYEPRPSDARALTQAELLVINGLEFEAWMPRLVEAAGYTGPQVVAAQQVKALPFDHSLHAPDHNHDHDHDHDHQHEKDHDHVHHHGEFDPHAWQSVRQAQRYIDTIRDGLTQARPESAELFKQNAQRYQTELKALDDAFQDRLRNVPTAQRKVITSHDAFAYLGKDYEIEFIGLVGVSNQAEPSAKEIATIVNQAKEQNIGAIFVENVVSAKLVEQVARETNAKVGGVLYSDALAKPPHEADSYVGMMRWNFNRLADALAP